MNPGSRSLPRCLVAGLTWAATVSGFCATAPDPGPTTDTPPLVLPKFTVNDLRELLPPESWRYARVPGLEILSQASDRETQKLLRDFQIFNEALDVVWPALKGSHPTPLSLIVCGAGKFAAFIPAATARCLRLHHPARGHGAVRHCP